MSGDTLLKQVLGDYNQFLDRLLMHLGSIASGRQIDHICYRVETADQYESTKALLLGFGCLLTESLVGGRPISIIQLTTPIQHGGFTIPFIELPSPKEGSHYNGGLEHAEVGSNHADALSFTADCILLAVHRLQTGSASPVHTGSLAHPLLRQPPVSFWPL